MGDLVFQHPLLLWGLVVTVPVLLALRVRSRSATGRWGQVASAACRTAIVALGMLALAAPVLRQRQDPNDHAVPILLLQDRSASVSDDPGMEDTRQSLLAAFGEAGSIESYEFAGGFWSSAQPPIETDQTDIEQALDAVG